MHAPLLDRISAAVPFVLAAKTRHLIRGMQPELMREIDEYPSLFNDGYLHIRRAVELIEHFALNPCWPVVDIGAAGGEVATILATLLPKATIHCFEPIAETFSKLTEKTQRNPRIKRRNVALGSKPGKLEIQLTHRITASSLLPVETSIQDDFFAENIRKVGTEVVTISTLDAEAGSLAGDHDRINLLKLDVQGYELEALRGGSETLSRVNIVVLEVQNHAIYQGAPRYYDLDAFLRDAGFTLFNIVPSLRRNKKMYEWDAIYVSNRIANKFDT